MSEESTHTEKQYFKNGFEKWYNKNYKNLLVIPAIILLMSLAYLGYSYYKTGDFITKDITLTGGTSITILSDTEISVTDLRNFLNEKKQDFVLREISDFRSGKQKAVIVESHLEASKLKKILEEFLGYEITSENSSIESTGSALGESFYKQLRWAVVISFVFMSIIVFLIFRTPIPSIAVVISAFADIIMTLTVVDLLGIKVSTAGITAILMLIGYSVDTDIMLTTRILKRQGETNKNLFSAFKTGITMTLTSLIGLVFALIVIQSFSEVLQQIFTILIIGLTFDIFNTWVTNLSILKWYKEVKNKQ